MNYAGKIGAKVANMSLGGAGTSAFLDDTIKNNPKVLFVVAAGNDGVNNDSFPHTPCVPAARPTSQQDLRGRHRQPGQSCGLFELWRQERRPVRAGCRDPEHGAGADPGLL